MAVQIDYEGAWQTAGKATTLFHCLLAINQSNLLLVTSQDLLEFLAKAPAAGETKSTSTEKIEPKVHQYDGNAA